MSTSTVRLDEAEFLYSIASNNRRGRQEANFLFLRLLSELGQVIHDCPLPLWLWWGNVYDGRRYLRDSKGDSYKTTEVQLYLNSKLTNAHPRAKLSSDRTE